MAINQASPHGAYNSAVPFPEYVDAVVLGAGTAETYTIPPAAGFAILTATLPFYARIVTGVDVAAAPSTGVTDGTSSFYVAAGMQCRLGSGKSLSLVRATAASTVVTIGVYRS